MKKSLVSFMLALSLIIGVGFVSPTNTEQSGAVVPQYDPVDPGGGGN